MVPLSLLVLGTVATGAIVAVMGVLYYGTRYTISPEAEESKTAYFIWQERARRVEEARQGLALAAEGGSSAADGSGTAALGAPDEAEARRQAALARKAARAAKPAE